MAHRFARFATASALQLVALVLAHELVFLARFGSRFGEALVHSGHGEAWSAAVLTSAGLAVALGAAGVFRLARLGLLVRRRGVVRVRLDPAGTRSLDAPSLLRGWLRLALRMAVVTVVLLTIQENLEHWSTGRGLPGLGILLSAEYPDALSITIVVAFAVSLVAALFEWRRSALLARLRAVRAPLPRAIETAPARPGVLVRPVIQSLLGRRSALRAPPPLVAS